MLTGAPSMVYGGPGSKASERVVYPSQNEYLPTR